MRLLGEPSARCRHSSVPWAGGWEGAPGACSEGGLRCLGRHRVSCRHTGLWHPFSTSEQGRGLLEACRAAAAGTRKSGAARGSVPRVGWLLPGARLFRAHPARCPAPQGLPWSAEGPSAHGGAASLQREAFFFFLFLKSSLFCNFYTRKASRVIVSTRRLHTWTELLQVLHRLALS